MNKRNNWIVIAAVALIVLVPLVTVVRVLGS